MKKNDLLIYLVKFLVSFAVLYLGTKAIIGLTVPGGYYNEWVARYFDYPSLLRSSLLNGSKLLVGAFGFDTFLRDAYHVAIKNRRGVHLVYSCLGYGLMSFWIAFIFANRGSFVKKATWMLGGAFVIWLINVIRISLVLVATNQQWKVRLSLDNHTAFNIVVYIAIFFMIWMFMRSEDKVPPTVRGRQAPEIR